MQRNILWKGIEYQSLENCILTIAENGATVHATIVGSSQDIIYKVDYQLHTNQFWQTTSLDLRAQLNDTITSISLHSDGNGNWTSGDQSMDAYRGCIDVDIPLTPLTNTLPVNRLKLSEGQQQQITVLYVDILGQQITPVRQKYSRLSSDTYKYENVPNDFEAIISVDDCGLVMKYPQLFECISIKHSNYR